MLNEREGHCMNVTSIPASHAAVSALPLEVDSLVKRFGQVTAVDGVSLELRGGECLGLLGPNGAGKSTLIRSIVGRVIPDAGRVAVFGSPADSAAARTALGWVPQELALYPRLTCKENLAAFGRYHGLSGEQARGVGGVVPGLGRAEGPGRRPGEEPFRRDEAAAQHGGGHHPSAQGCADG